MKHFWFGFVLAQAGRLQRNGLSVIKFHFQCFFSFIVNRSFGFDERLELHNFVEMSVRCSLAPGDLLGGQERRSSSMLMIQMYFFLTLVFPDLESLTHRQNIQNSIILNLSCSNHHSRCLVPNFNPELRWFEEEWLKFYCGRSMDMLMIYLWRLIINQMKSQQKENQIKMVNCKEHKEKCTFVCLHKTCGNGFKIGCQKCRKDHGQHPNRLISISDFHAMLSKPIHYLQNSTAYKLMNLKKKIQYIRNFRTSILEKEILLIESNQNIKTTTSAILEQHYRIRDIISHIDSDFLANHFQDYSQCLQKCREFLAYNPVKGNLVFNNDIIKSSRVYLQKHIKTSNELVDSIRQFLVKIIEVLLANCVHEEDDDDIEFDNQDGESTSFNIFIKNRTDVIENPNIKNKLEHEAFLEMFDEEKDALNQEIQILEKQLNFKGSILKKIRSTSSMAKPHPPERHEHEQDQNQEESSVQRLSSQQNFLVQTGESNFEKQKGTDQIMQLRQEYETVLKNKEDYIQQLKEICNRLEEKTQSVDSFIKQNKGSSSIVKQSQNRSEISDSSKEALGKRIAELQLMIEDLTLNCKEKQIQLETLNIMLSRIEEESEIKASSIGRSQFVTLQELNEKQTAFQTIIDKLKEELTKKDGEILRQKNKYSQLQQLVQKTRENNANSEKELLQWRNQHEQRQKKLRIQYESSRRQIQSLRFKVKQEVQKQQALKEEVERLSEQIRKKTEFMKATQRQLDNKQRQIMQLTKVAQAQRKEQQTETTCSQRTHNSTKTYEEDNRKIKEIKDMLEMSIKKNQELKDKIYQLERDVQEYKHQLRRKVNESRMEELSNGRRSFCRELIQDVKDPQFSLRFQTANSELVDPSPPFRKKGGKTDMNSKEDKRSTYLEIKNIFKAVTDDMKTLEERMKENNVIEKVYLKELERKRNQNKNLKKDLQNYKLYGNNLKQPDIPKSSSPCFKSDKYRQEIKLSSNSPFKTQAAFQHEAKKALKSNK